MQNDTDNWLTQEFARARARSAELPGPLISDKAIEQLRRAMQPQPGVRVHGVWPDEPMSETALFAWTISGESYHESSSDPWRIEEHAGIVHATGVGEALARITDGREAAPVDETIPWDLIEQDRAITITVRPIDADDLGGSDVSPD